MAFFRLKLLLCSIFIFYSLQQLDAAIAVHQGELGPVNCSTAILGMSGDSTHKTIWWQFLPLMQSYAEAFRVYMVLPQIPEGQCNIEEQLQGLGGLLSTRKASIAEDISIIKVKGLGSMTISMWMLGFLCPEGACKHVTPAVLRKNSSNNQYELFSVWEVDGDNVRNVAAARILNLPNENLDVQYFGGHAIAFRSIPGDQGQLPLCGEKERKPRPVPDGVVGNCSKKQTSTVPKPLCIDRENTSARVEQLIGSFMFQVKSSYIQAQTSAINLEHGPATEFWVAAIAFPSAFIAVVATALPITDYLLKLVRRKVLSHHMKILLICVVNSVVSIVSYGAVITLVPAELERQNSYKTWGLLADELPVSPRAHGLQVLIIVEGKSDYKSSSLILVSVTFLLLVPIMMWISFYRCNQVFKRHKLLSKLRELRPEEPGDERLDDLRAIEMTSAEQELLEKTLQNLQNATKSSLSHVRKSSWRSLRRMITYPRQPYTNGTLEVRLRVDGERSP